MRITNNGTYPFVNTRFFLAGLLLLCFYYFSEASDQTYGLKFASHDVLKENRTSLDLNPDQFFSFRNSFDLSFSFSLNEYGNMYFGYIVRIIDSENRNVDLLFNFRSPADNGFEIVYGENLTNQTLKTNFARLCREWHKLNLSFDLDNHQLTFSTPDTALVLQNIHITGKVKILFGASDCIHFKTTDVPPMNLKDIRIFSKDKYQYEWKLNESEGVYARETYSKLKAGANNPEWISPTYFNWKKSFKINLSGNAEFACNTKEELVYIIGEDRLLIYSVAEDRTDSYRYRNNTVKLKAGSQAFYDPAQHMIVSYNPDLRSISMLNLETMEWNAAKISDTPLTVYWHHNKFYDESKRLLYIFGGYGQHEYKNQINLYSVNEDKWQTLVPEGDSYPPRYLAALGCHDDSVYIIGGYGSISGKQILNPQNYFDLWVYSVNDNRFVKKYDFIPPGDDMVFANTMIINPDTREYYVFGFPNFKYDSQLQLYIGSLDSPGLEPAGDRIPYLFHDIISFADLFYFENSKKLAGVTALYDENDSTTISLYTIGFPPNRSPGPEKRKLTALNYRFRLLFIFIITGTGTLTVLFLLAYKRRRRKNTHITGSSELQENTGNGFSGQEDYKNSILFFGEFQIFNNQHRDITNKFSPLLKELFLLIWFNSLKDKGISSERIIDILWFDKGDKNAKNNLAVNMAKLKQTMSEIDSVILSRNTGYWKLSFDDGVVYNDYWHCIKLAANPNDLDLNKVIEIIDTIHKGHFLESCTFSWLDEFKAEISNKLIDALLAFTLKHHEENHPDFLLHLADAVLHLDLMNEEAIAIKCKALIAQGKHNLAKETFRKFLKEYKLMYNADFSKSFIEFTK